MKKIIALLLALTLVLTGVVAFAEQVETEAEVEVAAPKGTPNINTFAKMTVKYKGAKFADNQNWNTSDNYYEITLSKKVDRLLVKWAEKGAEPEELALDENLQATAIAWGHKYMPGTTQSYAKNGQNGGSLGAGAQTLAGYKLCNSEAVYNTTGAWDNSLYYDNDYCDSDKAFAEVTEYGPVRVFSVSQYVTDGKFDKTKWDNLVAAYKAEYSQYKNYEVQCPVVDTNGNLIGTGYIVGSRVFNRVNKYYQTVKATPDQAAFLTVQDGWAVYYNRAGKIVGIEPFEGQF
jgi:hypothetical protein